MKVLGPGSLRKTKNPQFDQLWGVVRNSLFWAARRAMGKQKKRALHSSYHVASRVYEVERPVCKPSTPSDWETHKETPWLPDRDDGEVCESPANRGGERVKERARKSV